jgi:L-erythro-3,5-diaminohexanoate dehydrogenase
MKARSASEEGRRLGADRVLAPAGALPQPAERLDAAGPVRAGEIEVAVERLCLDSTSFREIRERCDADPDAMAARIADIVARRGKMHNPATDSGGVLLGTVTAAGERFTDPPAIGERVVTLASLTLTPLRLDAITHLDPGSAQVEVTGTAYLSDSSPWGPLPDDLPLEMALELYDVYGAGSHTRDLAPPNGTVCVLGTGHAGKLALAAARDSMEGGTLVAVDVDRAAVDRVSTLGLCDIGVATDLRDPLEALEALRGAGAPPADLTVVVVSATGCEPTAILLTAPGGTVLFYSMATSFQTAALTADGMSADVTMLVGNGFAPDRGAYALDLARRDQALRQAFEPTLERAA